jgi:hypothetical protein
MVPGDLWPPTVISHHCFMVWARHDPAGLRALIEQRGPIRVRVPVPRQKWPPPTVG